MKHLFAIGRVEGDSRDVVIVPAQVPALVDAYDLGTLDARDGLECDPLKWFTDLGRIEQYVWGWRDASHQ